MLHIFRNKRLWFITAKVSCKNVYLWYSFIEIEWLMYFWLLGLMILLLCYPNCFQMSYKYKCLTTRYHSHMKTLGRPFKNLHFDFCFCWLIIWICSIFVLKRECVCHFSFGLNIVLVHMGDFFYLGYVSKNHLFCLS